MKYFEDEPLPDLKPEVLMEVTPEIVKDFVVLGPFLSENAPTHPDTVRLKLLETLSLSNARVMVIKADGHIRATQTAFYLPCAMGRNKGWFEDVVTDPIYVGRGFAGAIHRELLTWLKLMGAKSAELTSAHSRERAGGFYEHFGYGQRDTRVYHKDLGTTALHLDH